MRGQSETLGRIGGKEYGKEFVQCYICDMTFLCRQTYWMAKSAYISLCLVGGFSSFNITLSSKQFVMCRKMLVAACYTIQYLVGDSST